MFTALYIKKCIKKKAQDELQYFLMYPNKRDEKGYSEMKLFSFEEGYYFHCPGRMKEDEVKVVKETSRTYAYTSDPKESHPTDECK